MTLPDLIGKHGNAAFDLNFDDDNLEIITDFQESSAILNAVASDSARFASAAFQTIRRASIDVGDKERISWGIIQSYYASFYAAHAVSRVLGLSCSYFDRSHVQRIRNLGVALGRNPAFRVKSGAYLCGVHSNSTVIKSKNLQDVAGGSHEVFWNLFSDILDNLSVKMLDGNLSIIERQAVYAKLQSLRQVLQSRNAPLSSWLSVVRNDVQYRHKHKIWLPENIRAQERDRVSRILEQWKRDPMDVDIGFHLGGDLQEFSAAVAFIIAVCKAIFLRIAERSPRPAQSFAKLGPLALAA
ncbi:hypothetical protein ACFQU7_20415 [Pseudoroseomonas wenyumeiae]